jgi:hypothetical protein
LVLDQKVGYRPLQLINRRVLTLATLRHRAGLAYVIQDELENTYQKVTP